MLRELWVTNTNFGGRPAEAAVGVKFVHKGIPRLRDRVRVRVRVRTVLCTVWRLLQVTLSYLAGEIPMK